MIERIEVERDGRGYDEGCRCQYCRPGWGPIDVQICHYAESRPEADVTFLCERHYRMFVAAILRDVAERTKESFGEFARAIGESICAMGADADRTTPQAIDAIFKESHPSS